MTDGRWERIQALFHRALEHPPAERAGFVRAESGDDAHIAGEVLALLAEDERNAPVLDAGVSRLAHDLLAGGKRPVLPDDAFGAYRITDVLGEGGMGIVFLAERADLGTAAAIKILRDAWLSPARRERFAAEQRTLARLRHPSIAPLYDAGTLPDGTPWFVMEYVDGTPITEYCRDRASTVDERLRLFRDVCEAVRYAHQNLVVHRDLKPSNIFVRPDGTVALLDFGIAKHLQDADRPAEQTRTGIRFLTPAYAAPEQIADGPIGIHTDIYSLGVVLYELLVGRLPFELTGTSPTEAASILLEQEPERPSAAAVRMAYVGRSTSHIRATSQTAWADLDVLCLTAMHKEPERRYRSVEALIRDVDHYLRGEPLEARPDTLRYRTGKFVRRNWRVLGGVSAAVLLLVALVAFYTVRLTIAGNVARAEAARTQRIQEFMLTLFQGGESTVGPADSLRVVTLLDRGVQEARRLDRDPVIQAELYGTLGRIYEQLGDLPRADSLLRAALDQRRALFGAGHAEVAASLIALGLLRNAEAEYEEAERLVRQGVDMIRRSARDGDPRVGSAIAALGRVLMDRGEYDEAIVTLQDAAERQGAAGEAHEQASTLTLLANTHFYAGNYDASDSLNRQVLEIDRALYGARHPNVADDLINLGAIQFEGGGYAEAERFYREAHDILRAWYGTDHAETASSLVMIGRALVSQQRVDDAVPLLRDALRTYERVYGAVHPRIASTLNELGRLAQQQGRLDDAEAYFRRMTEIYRTVHQDRHYLIGVALSNLAGVHQARGDFREAERLFRDVLRRYEDVISPDHQLVGIAHARLARALFGQARYADAAAEAQAAASNLTSQTTPPRVWLDHAHETLAASFDSLARPDDAARVRAQMGFDEPATLE